MNSLPPGNEIIGLTVALMMALGLISLLLWIKGISVGLPPRHVRQTLLRVWLAVGLMIAALIALRLLLGTELISGSPTEGLTAAGPLPLWGWVLIVLVFAFLAAVAWRLRRLLVPFHSAPDADGSC